MNESLRSVRQILVGTDFSETADAAIDWAMEIARAHGSKIILAHAVSLPMLPPDYVPAPPEFSMELQEAARRRLEDGANRLRQENLEVSSRLLLGPASQSLLDLIDELDPQLIVLGTRGQSGLRHLFLGSTAERVVQRSPVPVLTIHPQDAQQHRSIRSILVPTDFSEDAKQATAAAHGLLAQLEKDAAIILLHAYHLPVEYTAYGSIPTSLDYLKDAGADSEARLGEIASALRREGLAVETVAREGYPAEVIVEEAGKRGVDLIAMGTHGRSGLTHLLLGSTAERVVQHAPCPVLTVRREE